MHVCKHLDSLLWMPFGCRGPLRFLATVLSHSGKGEIRTECLCGSHVVIRLVRLSLLGHELPAVIASLYRASSLKVNRCSVDSGTFPFAVCTIFPNTS